MKVVAQKEYDIFVAGGGVAAEGEAWHILRVIPPAILSGQTAGAAAAQAIDLGCPVAPLQEVLPQANVTIHFDDALVPEEIVRCESADI